MNALSLPEQAFDELPTEVAILDERGEIIYTNRAWRTFASANGYTGELTFVGVNYLAVCDAAREESEEAAAVADGLRRVLHGADDVFAADYPCHSPTEQRWFLMRAVPFESPTGGRHALVLHMNITDRRLAENRVKVQNTRLKMLAYILSTDLEVPLTDALSKARELAQQGNDVGRELLGSLERIDVVVGTGAALAWDDDTTIEMRPVTLRKQAETAWYYADDNDASFLVFDSRELLADPNLLQLLFDVLFSNALEHGGDTVRVRVGTTHGGFFVEDDGPGIAPEDRARVLEAGVVLDPTANGEERGMGLAVAARIAELHGWTIRVEQSGLGGARVEVDGVEWT